jgi:hypothetical protein
MTMSLPRDESFSAPETSVQSGNCFQTSFQSDFPFSQESGNFNMPFGVAQDSLNSWDQLDSEWDAALDLSNYDFSRDALGPTGRDG